MSLDCKIRTRAYGLKDSLPFGKYKGQLISDIIEEDPSYLLWCVDYTAHFSLTAMALKYAQESASERGGLGEYYNEMDYYYELLASECGDKD